MSRDTLRETGELFNHLCGVLDTKPYKSELRCINTQIVNLNSLRLDLSKLLKLTDLTRETLDVHPYSKGGRAEWEPANVPSRACKYGDQAQYFFTPSQNIVIADEIRGCLDSIVVQSKDIHVIATDLYNDVQRLAKDLHKVASK